MISAFRIIAIDAVESSVVAVRTAFPADADRIQIDKLALSNTITEVLGSHGEQQGTLIALPIHLATLRDNLAFMSYQHLIERGQSAIQRSIVLTIEDADGGLPDARLNERVRKLRRSCRAVAAVVPLDTDDFATWKDLGLSLVGIDVARFEGPEAALFARLDQFCTLAFAARLRTFVFGLASRSAVMAAATMGFDFVEGSPVGGLGNFRPDRMLSFEFEDLYRRGRDQSA